MAMGHLEFEQFEKCPHMCILYDSWKYFYKNFDKRAQKRHKIHKIFIEKFTKIVARPHQECAG